MLKSEKGDDRPLFIENKRYLFEISHFHLQVNFDNLRIRINSDYLKFLIIVCLDVKKILSF